MGKMRFVAISLLVTLITIIIIPSFARSEEKFMEAYPDSRVEDNHVKTIFMDTFYGMAAGTLIAAAISLAQDTSPKWGRNIGIGATIGGLGGAVYGIVSEIHYLSSIENGKVYVSAPSIVVSADKRDGEDVMYTAGLFQYKF